METIRVVLAIVFGGAIGGFVGHEYIMPASPVLGIVAGIVIGAGLSWLAFSFREILRGARHAVVYAWEGITSQGTRAWIKNHLVALWYGLQGTLVVWISTAIFITVCGFLKVNFREAISSPAPSWPGLLFGFSGLGAILSFLIGVIYFLCVWSDADEKEILRDDRRKLMHFANPFAVFCAGPYRFTCWLLRGVMAIIAGASVFFVLCGKGFFVGSWTFLRLFGWKFFVTVNSDARLAAMFGGAINAAIFCIWSIGRFLVLLWAPQ